MEAFDTITCRAVSRSFGRTSALRGVDLELSAGELTSVVGPNGAGKTTLLWVLSTLLSPSSGEVAYGEIPHRRAATTCRGNIGLVSHGALLYPELSAVENLRFFAELYGLERRGERIIEMLELVGIPPSSRERPVFAYSRGMTQRLALARAMLHDPRLLLLDEPFTGLDLDATHCLMDTLGVRRNENKALVLVTHDLGLAAEISDKIVVMSRGHIVETLDSWGDASSVSNAYRDLCSEGTASVGAL